MMASTQKLGLSMHTDSVTERQPEPPTPNGKEPPEDLYGTGRNARVETGKAGGKLRQQPRNNQDGTSQNPQGRHISDKRCCVQVDNVCKTELL